MLSPRFQSVMEDHERSACLSLKSWKKLIQISLPDLLLIAEQNARLSPEGTGVPSALIHSGLRAYLHACEISESFQLVFISSKKLRCPFKRMRPSVMRCRNVASPLDASMEIIGHQLALDFWGVQDNSKCCESVKRPVVGSVFLKLLYCELSNPILRARVRHARPRSL